MTHDEVSDSAERNFIGLMLSSEDVASTINNYPKKEWFHNRNLGKISEAIEKSSCIDTLEISKLSGVSQKYIIEIQIDAPISLNPNAYAAEIYNLYRRRTITTIATGWLRANITDNQFFIDVEADISTIQQISGGIHEVLFAGNSLDLWLEDKQERISGAIRPVKSGFPALDSLFAGGLHRGDLITVAGRPGSGKSAFIKSMLVNMVRIEPSIKVAIFSIEMTPNEYLDRMCSEWAEIDGTKLREAVNLSDNELDRLVEFSKFFHDKNFTFNRMQGCTVLDIKRLAKAAKLKMQGLDMIFVDHLHIIKSHNRKLLEQDRIAEITIELKRLGQDLVVPVVLAAQCNREQEKRQDKTPQMSDLRGSGAIEQDSNCILFIHRPGLYDDSDVGITQVAVRKNRHGSSPCELNFKFKPEHTAFIQLA